MPDITVITKVPARPIEITHRDGTKHPLSINEAIAAIRALRENVAKFSGFGIDSIEGDQTTFGLTFEPGAEVWVKAVVKEADPNDSNAAYEVVVTPAEGYSEHD